MNADGTDRYFDYAATAPPFAEALTAQAEAARAWFGNPSASHQPGAASRTELERLRGALAALCGYTDGHLVLMSGATEANNWVVHGVMRATGASRVLVAADVHASVWNPCRRCADRMDTLPLDSSGRVSLDALTSAIRPDTRLVCCSHVASETGVIQDVGAIAAACRRRGIPCHIDGTQALGRIPVDLAAIACDFYTFSAHKFGGPRGCGGVFVRAPAVAPLLDGGAQEGGQRPGTENLPALAGAVVALERSLTGLTPESERLRALIRTVLAELESSGTKFLMNGAPDKTAPGFLSLSFPGVDGHALVADLALQGFAIASGSACSENKPDPSRAILALGRSPAEALGTIRLSLGRSSRPEAVAALAKALVETVRKQAGPACSRSTEPGGDPQEASPLPTTPNAAPPAEPDAPLTEHAMTALRSTSKETRQRLCRLINGKEPYFILTGSDPRDATGCCPSNQVAEANRLVDAGLLACYRTPAPAESCTTTLYTFIGEIRVRDGQPEFFINASARRQAAAILDRTSQNFRNRDTVLKSALLLLLAASLLLAGKRALLAFDRAPSGFEAALARSLEVKSDDSRLFVCLFHGRETCPACEAMDRLCRQTVETEFAPQVRAGLLTLRQIPSDAPVNRAIKDRFGLYSSTVGLVRYDHGRPGDFLMLTQEVWRLWPDDAAFSRMLRDKIRGLLPGNS